MRGFAQSRSGPAYRFGPQQTVLNFDNGDEAVDRVRRQLAAGRIQNFYRNRVKGRGNLEFGEDDDIDNRALILNRESRRRYGNSMNGEISYQKDRQMIRDWTDDQRKQSHVLGTPENRLKYKVAFQKRNRRKVKMLERENDALIADNEVPVNDMIEVTTVPVNNASSIDEQIEELFAGTEEPTRRSNRRERTVATVRRDVPRFRRDMVETISGISNRKLRRNGSFYGYKYNGQGYITGVDIGYWKKVYGRLYGNNIRIFPAKHFADYPVYGKGSKLHWQYSELDNGEIGKWKRIPVGWLYVPTGFVPRDYLTAGGVIHKIPPLSSGWLGFD